MTKKLLASQLTAFSPLNGMKRRNLVALIDQIELREAQRGETLFDQGDTAKTTFYLLSGTIELRERDVVVQTITAGTDAASFPLAPALPRAQTAVAGSLAELITIDSEALDLMLTWDQTGVYEVGTIGDASSEDEDDWMIALLRSSIFQQIPPTNIHKIFTRLEQVNYKTGHVVIRQGDEGAHFYIIRHGRCRVTRDSPLSSEAIELASLTVGDTFGAEALLSEGRRNATITMQTDGSLMRLSKADFQALMTEPLLEWVDYENAKTIVAAGGRWLDVRLSTEFALSHLEGAVNLPLQLLHVKSATLEPSKKYVVCCDTSARSSAAAFLLIQKGIQAAVLKDGLNAVRQ